MNILHILTFYGLNSPKSGGQSRSLNITNQIKKQGNNIIILEPEINRNHLDSKYCDVYYYNHLKFLSRIIHLSKDFNLNFIKQFRGIITRNKVDIILTSHPSGMIIIKIVMFLVQKKIPIIYDAQNVESDFVKEIFNDNTRYSKLEQLIIPWYVSSLENIACKYLVNHVTTVSVKDKNRFIEKYKLDSKKVSVIPSGCNINKFINKLDKNGLKEKYGIDPTFKVVIFHGSFSHPPNEDALKIIEQYIAKKFNNLKILFLVGGSGFPTFERDNIKSIGFINNLDEFLSIADIAIVPILKGGGTKIKILDYLSAGLPIVTTKKGIDGIEAKNGEHILVSDSVNDEFIDNIKYLLENDIERIKIGQNARKLAKEVYDWNKIGKNLNELYMGILDNYAN